MMCFNLMVDWTKHSPRIKAWFMQGCRRGGGGGWEGGLTDGPQSRAHPSLMGISTTVTFGASSKAALAPAADCISRKPVSVPETKKRKKDYAFWCQFNEKPSHVVGCPGCQCSYCITCMVMYVRPAAMHVGSAATTVHNNMCLHYAACIRLQPLNIGLN